MSSRLTRWLHAQFIRSHTWRDVDLDYWWQMPDDETRTRSPWLQLPVDLVTRATFSEWHEKVTESRIRDYDRLRPYLSRATFLILIALGLGILDPPWWCWAMLAPAALQVSLEILLHGYVHESRPEPRWGLVRRMRDIVDDHYRTKMLNVTGVLGIAACPLNLLAVSLSPPGDELDWVKAVALASAIFYLNSGLASAFLDPSNYTETSTMPPVMHWVRPVAPALSLAVVVAIVAVGVVYDRWAFAVVPLAYATATLTLLLGGTIRNHDRMIAAAAPVARKAVVEARKELGAVVHDDLNPAKTTAETVRQIPGVPYRDYVELASLEAYLTHFSTRIGLYAAPRMRINDLVEKIASPYGLSPADVTYDIRWDPDIRRENHTIAIKMTTALVLNAAQTLQETRNLNVPRSITVEGFSTGIGHDICYHLAVQDSLPIIDPAHWCAAGSTLGALRDWLEDTFGGTLTQERRRDGTKRIVASWRDRPPVRRYSDASIGEDG